MTVSFQNRVWTGNTMIALVIIATGFLILYAQVIVSMIQVWLTNDNYSHGFFIPLLSGYLIWQQRKRLSELEFKPSNAGFILLVLSLGFYIITNIGAELFTMRVSMMLVLYALIVYLMGWRAFHLLFIPIAYLVFMIPFPAIIWNMIAFPLKLFATRIAVAGIHLLDVPVYNEGNIIYLANTTLEVVDACSGLRSLTTLLSLNAFIALISNTTILNKIIIFLAAIPVAIALNVVRLITTALLAQKIGPAAAHGFLHEASGMLVFIIALIIIGCITHLLRREDRQE